MEYFEIVYNLDDCEVMIEWFAGFYEEDIPQPVNVKMVSYETGQEMSVNHVTSIEELFDEQTWKKMVFFANEHKHSGEMRLSHLEA